MEITDLDQTVAMTAMKGELKPSRFLFGLEKRFPTNSIEMLTRAKKYANAEKAMMAKNDAPASRTERKNKRRDEPSNRD